MNGVAEGIEYGGDVEFDFLAVLPDVRHGEHNVFGKCAGAANANPLSVSTKMTASGEAVTATAAHHVTFSANEFANPEVRYV